MLLSFLTAVSVLSVASALLSQKSCVTFTPPSTTNSSTYFSILRPGASIPPIYVDPNDSPAIHVNLAIFAADLKRVTGKTATIKNLTYSNGKYSLSNPGGRNSAYFLVGSVVGSSLIKEVVNGGQFQELKELDGQWESWKSGVVAQALQGFGGTALVVAGSDKRGTIYGLYAISEMMGVSPWYWWADVPVTPRQEVFFLGNTTCGHGEPSVKYRGFFINDEQPGLTNWANYYYKRPRGSPTFLADFYANVFELILRLNANYMWSAEWAGMFYVDGLNGEAPNPNPLPTTPTPGPNAVLVDRYGLTMGTAHNEPMARTLPEWNTYGKGDWNWTTNQAEISAYWTYGVERAKNLDTLYSVGMRGNGDIPLPGANIPIMENIAASQREIFAQVYNTSDVTTIPQMWCMYKEVMSYYATGLQVPDDIIVLFADDNWGNLMRAPETWEQNRSGGAGIYYHMDYVGSPRDYKWINTVSIPKTWEQMNQAYERKALGMSILNVGDIKPLEMPIEFFLSYAYDNSLWDKSNLTLFYELWATREFGSKYAAEIADIVGNYSMYNSRIKPELINSTTFSITAYREADNVLAQWQNLLAKSETIYAEIPTETQPAFWELVLGPVAMMTNLVDLYISVGKNNLMVTQLVNSANSFAAHAQSAFQNDYNLTKTYHSLLGGKWNHMLDQAHINYQYWQQPMKNSMPPVGYVQLAETTEPQQEGWMRVTVEGSLGAWPGDNVNNCGQGYGCPDPTLQTIDNYGPGRWARVSAGGPNIFTWNATSNSSWLLVSPSSGTIRPDGSTDSILNITVDWNKFPKSAANATGTITIANSEFEKTVLTIPAFKAAVPDAGFKGHVEGNGYVAIEAEHWTRNTPAGGSQWEVLPGFGRTLSGIGMYPVTLTNFTVGEGPSVEYDFWVTNVPGRSVTVTAYTSPSMNFVPSSPLKYALQFDDGAPQQFTPVPSSSPGTTPPDWNGIVSWEVRLTWSNTTITETGSHTLKVWGMNSGVVFERFLLDFGGVHNSYLGPPESYRIV